MAFVTAEPVKASLKTKRKLLPAPVDANIFPEVSTTLTLTDVPDCVSVTVPKFVAVPHPFEISHDVKLKVSAFAAPRLIARAHADAATVALNLMSEGARIGYS